MADLAFLIMAVSSIIHILDDQAEEREQGGSDNYVEMYYEAHLENGIMTGFLAASIFLIVCVTIDR